MCLILVPAFCVSARVCGGFCPALICLTVFSSKRGLRLVFWSVKYQKIVKKRTIGASQGPRWRPQTSCFIHKPRDVQIAVVEEETNKLLHRNVAQIPTFILLCRSWIIEIQSAVGGINYPIRYQNTRRSGLETHYVIQKVYSQILNGREHDGELAFMFVSRDVTFSSSLQQI